MQKITLAPEEISAITKAAENAFDKLFKLKKYTPKHLRKVKEYKQLINETNKVLQSAINEGIKDNDVPERMLESLCNDVFVFSGLKTHAQLFEASRQLLTEDQKPKPFYQFKQDYEKVNGEYNEQYLEAEYQFATTSAQMAAKWADVEQNKGRYNLQYRTAGDSAVRPAHAALHGITLPADNPFWEKYYAPNGWRCRCNVVEILKDKYPVSDSSEALEKGEAATTQLGKDGKNRLEIFRFNPGKEQVIFPPKHPYNKVQGAKEVKAIIGK